MQLIDSKNVHPRRISPSSIFIREGDLHIKNIVSKSDRLKAHRLRHKIFCQELGWVPGNTNMLEIDDYDKGAIFFGVFDNNDNLKAYLRIVTSDNCFMLEKEFPFLLMDGLKVRKELDTVEVSRLCVAPEARSETFSGNFGVHTNSMLLYKGVYHWCMKNRKQYLYLVVEEKIFRLLCARGFPCKLLGEPKIMPDGVVAVAAMLNWREFEELNAGRRTKMMAWFKQYQSGLPIRQSQQHEFYSQHQA